MLVVQKWRRISFLELKMQFFAEAIIPKWQHDHCITHIFRPSHYLGSEFNFERKNIYEKFAKKYE